MMKIQYGDIRKVQIYRGENTLNTEKSQNTKDSLQNMLEHYPRHYQTTQNLGLTTVEIISRKGFAKVEMKMDIF